MASRDLRLFALDASRPFAELVAQRLGISLDRHEEREFEDGEHKSRPLEGVRGKDVFVIQSLYGDARQSVDDKLCRLLFFIGALVDASAERVTAVIPYLAFARKERKTQPRDPVTSRYLACLLEAVGAHRVLTMDVHNLAAFQNAFRCRTDHLEAAPLFIDYFAHRDDERDFVVVAPDAGGVKRAEHFRLGLGRALGRDLPMAFMEKHRSGGEVRGGAVVGEVAGKAAIILDDLISTGTTVARSAVACRERGARRVFAVATHGLFAGAAERALANPALDRVVVANTVPPFRLVAETVRAKLSVLDAAPLFADAIQAIHGGGSISRLLEI